MNIKSKTHNLVLMLCYLPSLSLAAVDNTSCQIIHWQADHVYTLKGQINFATHIIFPVPEAVQHVVGNASLWHVESQGNHLFYKPTNKDNPDGKTTTLSFTGVNNKSYEFILERVDSGAAECVVIKDDQELLGRSWQHYQTPDQQMVKLLSTSLRQQKAQAQSEKASIIKQQRHALNQYRSQIYTRYSWKGGNNWWKVCNINSVYDDSRWTYVRLNEDNKGIMSIYGMIAGKQERLQYSYDAQTKIYKISGIYQTLVLIYDKTTITIVRQS